MAPAVVLVCGTLCVPNSLEFIKNAHKVALVDIQKFAETALRERPGLFQARQNGNMRQMHVGLVLLHLIGQPLLPSPFKDRQHQKKWMRSELLGQIACGSCVGVSRLHRG